MYVMYMYIIYKSYFIYINNKIIISNLYLTCQLRCLMKREKTWKTCFQVWRKFAFRGNPKNVLYEALEWDRGRQPQLHVDEQLSLLHFLIT